MGVTYDEIRAILNGMRDDLIRGDKDAESFRQIWIEHNGTSVESTDWILASEHPYVAIARVHLLTAQLKGKL